MGIGFKRLKEYPKNGGTLFFKTGVDGMGSAYMKSGTTYGNEPKGGMVEWLSVQAYDASAGNFSVGLFESGTDHRVQKLTKDSSLGVAGSYFMSRTPTPFVRELMLMVSGGTALGAGSFDARMIYNPATGVL